MTKKRTLAADRVRTRGPKVGHCSLCSNVAVLTEDHIPPKGSVTIAPREMRTVAQHLDTTESQPRIAQGGVKYRSLCLPCNRDVLGREFDPQLVSLSKQAARVVASTLTLPDPMRLTVKPQRVARAVIGHLLAAYVPPSNAPSVLSAPFNDAMRAYVLDRTAPLPDKIEIFYWPYPSQINAIICGCCIGAIKGGLSAEPVLGHFLKFFPLAYWVVWERPTAARIPMPSFDAFRRLSIDDDAEMVLTKQGAPRLDWPEHPDSDQWLLFDNGQTNISVWR